MFQARHFRIIAMILHAAFTRTHCRTRRAALTDLVRDFANAFSTDNTRFDRDRFVGACTPDTDANTDDERIAS